MALLEALIVFSASVIISVSIAAGLVYGAFKTLQMAMRYAMQPDRQLASPSVALAPKRNAPLSV